MHHHYSIFSSHPQYLPEWLTVTNQIEVSYSFSAKLQMTYSNSKQIRVQGAEGYIKDDRKWWLWPALPLPASKHCISFW
jgi:hypothetical protein